jgi:hypothetical protein
MSRSGDHEQGSSRKLASHCVVPCRRGQSLPTTTATLVLSLLLEFVRGTCLTRQFKPSSFFGLCEVRI